jgi:hypothetical protein
VIEAGRALCVRPAPRAADDDRLPLFVRGEVEDLLSPVLAETRGLFVLDLGNDWVPEILRGGVGPDGRSHHSNHYESTYRALANEAWPDDHHGRRARRDRYLELYGIVPSLTVLARRFREVRGRSCYDESDLATISEWDGLDLEENESPSPDENEQHEAALRAIQGRLACDGHYRGHPTGVLDARTRAAIAEFERRHRIYARGSLNGPTLQALKTDPLELERRALVRTLAERAILELGVVEDGSVSPHNLEFAVAARVERALGIGTIVGARRFLRQVGDPGPRCPVTFTGVELPEYHRSEDLHLYVVIDRGDVWYEFPFDAAGAPREQPLERRPTLTLFARVDGRRIPLVRYGTTIGGWRLMRQNGDDVWQYKESPVGRRLWSQIVSAPVWLPPQDVQPSSLVMQTRRSEDGQLVPEINLDLVGPGYASAYGLVAAYHRTIEVDADGDMVPGVDEGIRTHGSGDYTSVWRVASLGCHRLHNHRALRLFSFILKHQGHRRLGHRPVRYRIPVDVDGFSGEVHIDRTGYVFELDAPIVVEVLRGRIRGRQRRASTRVIPADEVGGQER